MDEYLSILVGFACVLTVVALVGHALWLAAAKLLGAISGGRPTNAGRHVVECPRCATRLGGNDLHCYVCGWPSEFVIARSQQRALTVLERHLERYQQAGLIDHEVQARIKLALSAEQERLSTPAVAPSQPPIPLAAIPLAASRVQAPTRQPAAAPEVEYAVAEIVDEPAVPKAPVEVWSSTSADPAERVRQFITRQSERAPAAQPSVEMPSGKVATAGWSQLLASFLEEKHIRWGELVGGLLIVCCSIALLISFWSRIAELPILKFLVFNGVTASLFGVSFYSSQRWKLPTTSQGLFLIATLLVPLNFLAIAAFPREATGHPWLTYVGEALSIALFACLVYHGGRRLVETPLALTLGVLGPSVSQLLVRRFVDPDMATGPLYAIAAVPLVAFLVATLWPLWRVRGQEFDEPRINSLFSLLGLVTFATLLAIALLLIRSEQIYDTLHRLAPLATLFAAPHLATGLLLWRRATRPELAAMRTAGTAIGALGAMVMAAGMVLAWPDAAMLLPAVLLNFLMLSMVAVICQIPAAHVPANLCLALGWLLSSALWRGDIGWHSGDGRTMLASLVSGSNGALLVPIVVLLGAVGLVLRRARRPAESRSFAYSCLVIGLISLAMTSWYGLGRTGDPSGATWVYGFYALAMLVAGSITARREAVVAGSLLLLLALVQGLVFGYAGRLGLSHPWIVALLVHATISVVWGSILRALGGLRVALAARVLSQGAFVASAVAVALGCWVGPQQSALWLAAHAAWVAAVWLLIARLEVSHAIFVAFQSALALSVVFAVTSQLETRAWFQDSAWPWLDPWTLQAQGIALAATALMWIVLRLALRRRHEQKISENEPAPATAPGFASLLAVDKPALDRWLPAALIVLAAVLSTYGAMPGAAQELTPRKLASQWASLAHPGAPGVIVTSSRVVPDPRILEVPGIPHQHALDYGSWLLLAALAIVLLASQWQQFSPWRMLGLLVVASLVCPLLAGRFESQVATASAMRWLTAAFLALVSIVVWAREPLKGVAERLGWRLLEPTPLLRRDANLLAILLVSLPLVAMCGYVSFSALWQRGVDAYVLSWWNTLAVGFVVAAGLGLALRAMPADWFATDVQPTAGWQTWLRQASLVCFVLGTGPLVVISIYVVSVSLQGNPIVGPEPGSFFARIGLAASYALPVLLIALTLVGHAVRERSAGFAFAAGLLLNVSATAAWLLIPRPQGLTFDSSLWIRLAQLNMAVCAAYGLAWLAATVWSSRRREPGSAAAIEPLLVTQVTLPMMLGGLLLVSATCRLFIDPLPALAHESIAGAWGWSSLLLTLAAFGCVTRSAGGNVGFALAASVLSIAALASFSLTPWDVGQWLVFHAMLVTLTLSACLPLALAWLRGDRTNASTVAAWTSLVGGAAAVWALRGAWSDPARPWWSAGAWLVLSLVAAGLACWSYRRRYLYVAAALLNLAASLVWAHFQWQATTRFSTGVLEMLYLNIAVLAAPTAAWLWLELRVIRSQSAGSTRWHVPGFHVTSAVVPLLLLCALVVFGLAAEVQLEPLPIRAWLGWLALAAIAAALLACLWDERMKTTVVCLYVLGLAAIGMTLDQFNLSPRWLGWTGAMMVASYTLATSYLWSRRHGLMNLAAATGIPRRMDNEYAGQNWLVAANSILIAGVVGLAVWVDFTFPEQSLRLLTAKAAIIQAFAMAMLARGEKRSPLQKAALLLGVAGSVVWGWAWLAPSIEAPLLHRTVVVTVALAAMIAVYGLGLVKLLKSANEWTQAALRLVPSLVVLAVASILLVLGLEVLYQFQDGRVPMARPAIAAVIAALLTVIAASLLAAVVPGRDPLGLSERGRTLYVYGAEAALAMLFLHIRLTIPELFRGFFQQYWPFIVMLLAFVGVGLSEWFRRERQAVLAEPLENTGAFLPLLPVLGFWIAPVSGHYSLLLLTVGALYATLSVTKRSFGFGVLAAIALNGALWYLLYQTTGLGLLEHPQLWLIPPALCVLAAAYLNRDRLSDAQMTNIRYVASMVIYVSSTADIFLTGLAEAPWLPLVLAALSVAGIFVGILLRVRAFLFLGTSFLLLALLTMIWHAAHDLQHTWIWSVSGIVAGMVIIALFALFEKKRQEVLRLVDQLKEWEA